MEDWSIIGSVDVMALLSSDLELLEKMVGKEVDTKMSSSNSGKQRDWERGRNINERVL